MLIALQAAVNLPLMYLCAILKGAVCDAGYIRPMSVFLASGIVSSKR